MELVSVQYKYEYKARDGHLVSIKPNESYILISKTNDHWWHVCKDQHSKPFYIPAQYVREIPSLNKDLLDPGPNSCHPAEFVTNSEPVDMPAAKPDGEMSTVRVPAEEPPKDTFRFSTFGLCDNLPNVAACEHTETLTGGHASSRSGDVLHHVRTHSSAAGPSFTSTPLNTDGQSLYTQPVPKARRGHPQRLSAGSLQDEQVELPNTSRCQIKTKGDISINFPVTDNSIIYETIPDLTEPASEVPYSELSGVENESLKSAVYVNVAELRQSISESPPSAASSCSPSYLNPEGWEVHVDQGSGQEYYYHPATGRTTWDNPFLDSPMDPEALPAEEPCSPSPSQSPALSPSTASPSAWTSDWEQLVDEVSGRLYFYNPMSGETSWQPPEPLSPYPPLMEPLGAHRLQEDGPVRAAPLSHSLSPVLWIKSLDDRGQTYYYLRDGSKSQWNLPEVKLRSHDTAHPKILLSSSPPTVQRFVPTHRRNASDYGSDSSSTIKFSHSLLCVRVCVCVFMVSCVIPTTCLLSALLCCLAILILLLLRKNWVQSWTVLHGGVLTFHKDPKSTATGNKTNQIVPEVTVDLRGAVVTWASRDKSSKKNVLELKSKNGVEFLIQYDTDSIINDWHKVLVDTIRQLDHHSEEDVDYSENSSITEREEPSVHSSSSNAGDTDQKRVRTKLMKFLLKRPTLQSVKEKGYIRENVFGCHLATLCAQEKTTVPRFVEKCIRAVEKRGLDIDGIYRVSGNLAVIQKLRFKADHEELDLEDGQWEDIHVITGALKLFFRELPEPLFPYSHFNGFIKAIRTVDHHTKVSFMCDLVKSLPAPNHDTMQLLFGHLRNVIRHGDENRMSVQNVAIVFGPTLLRPETESANITMHMVFQNQIVELILNEYEVIFFSS
uniref:Rho GTPase activating protein 27 n=1 Tax=Myripristis murdjan TaxID=586833 RepID=A0A668AHQ3_9TELE